MENGSYKSRKIDWTKLQVNKLPITIFSEVGCGCGANALSLLLGKSPREFAIKSDHYSDEYMLRVLKKYGISATKITKSNLTNTSEIIYKLDDRHVILASQLLRKRKVHGLCM